MSAIGLTPKAHAVLDSLTDFFAALPREQQARFTIAVFAILLIDQSEETAQSVLRAARGLQKEFEKEYAAGYRGPS